jgi:hypothetical protein
VARPNDDQRPTIARLTGEDLERQRDIDRTSLVGVAAASYGADPRLGAALERLGVQVLPLDLSLFALAQSTEAGTRVAPRIAVLDMLVRLATRQGTAPFAHDNAAMTALLQALVIEAHGPNDPHIPELVEDLRAAFFLAGSTTMTSAAWSIVQPTATRTLALTSDEEHAPRCMDEEPITVHGYEAAQISVEFTTDRSVPQMAPWADPRTWPSCSVYFTDMRPIDPVKNYAGPPGGWDATFLEVVDYPGRVLETPLVFAYREDFANGMVSSEYSLHQATADIVVDEGFVEAINDPTDPSRPTRVRCLKIIRFVDPDLQATASLACDTFWIELAMTMALNCSGSGPNP